MKFVTYSQQDLLQLNGTAILKFYANWCVPCRALTTTLKSEDFSDNLLTVLEVDVDIESELADFYSVKGIPTMLFLKKGKEVARITGNQNTDEIKEFIERGLLL